MKTILFVLLSFVIYSCDIDVKPETVSTNIKESKERKVFICEYQVIKQKFDTTIFFNYDKIWIERCWESYKDINGDWKFRLGKRNQLAISFKDLSLFDKDIYLSDYRIDDAEGSAFGSMSGVLVMLSTIPDRKPQYIRLNFIMMPDTKNRWCGKKFGEILLQRK